MDASTGSPSAPPEFVVFEGGEFSMGTPRGALERGHDEPSHRVTIEHSVSLQTTEVTRSEWETLMQTRPWQSLCDSDDCPVETVNWYDAVAYANARSAREGLPECYRLADCNGLLPGEGFECATAEAVGVGCAGYRLPTEAEWEYAARGGGLDRRYPWGDAPATCERAVMNDRDQGDHGCGTSGPLPVCSRLPGRTPHGLCDMAGNVWEWVEDWYGPYDEAPVDGSARPQVTQWRVFRGGGWLSAAFFMRAANRNRYRPDDRFVNLGFRLARTVP